MSKEAQNHELTEYARFFLKNKTFHYETRNSIFGQLLWSELDSFFWEAVIDIKRVWTGGDGGGEIFF